MDFSGGGASLDTQMMFSKQPLLRVWNGFSQVANVIGLSGMGESAIRAVTTRQSRVDAEGLYLVVQRERETPSCTDGFPRLRM
jgi:hypothetical protein